MRLPGRERRRRSIRPRVVLIVLVVVGFVLLSSMRGIAGFYTDYLWFKGIGVTEVWRGLIWAKVLPALVFTIAFFGVLLVNLIVADRLAPAFRPTGNPDDLVERYRQVMGPYAARVRIGVAVLLSLIAGTGVASQWREWLLFRNRVSFGVVDPQFHKDIGFYVFTMPFLKYIAEWTFAALVILLIVTALAHYLNGGIRPQGPFQRVTPQVKAHLSVILGAMALLKAFSYWLQRFELNFSTRGFVSGATYTDVHAQLPALRLLVIISVAAAALLLANIFMRGWMLPIIAVGMWAVVSVVIGAIVPAFVQNFRVKPNERSLERPYIKRNIDSTRAAYKLGGVQVAPFSYQASLDAQKVQAASDTVGNARLWDPFPFTTLAVYKQIQQIRPFYQFTDVDIDRYQVSGSERSVVVSPRELDHNNLPNNSWQNRHLVYTHGYGIVMSPTNEATPDGQPQFIVKDIPPQSSGVDVTQPAIYYGEATDDYALVGTKQKELDFANGAGVQKETTCTQCGGVRVAGLARRLAFWMRFGDTSLVTTKQLTANSKILYVRNIRDRVKKAAPFLKYDADPYMAVVDGRVKWIIDAYTTSDRYPYSTVYQPSGQGRLDNGSGLLSHFNYVRNSVKAVVDAYDGSMKFWIVDSKDPIARAYSKAFPHLFSDGTKMPSSLRAHLRYPEDVFRVQTDMFATYHIDSPDVFYSRSDQWAVSPDPGTGQLSKSSAATGVPAPAVAPNANGTVSLNAPRMDPYYLFMRLPGAAKAEFVLLEPFVPVSRGDSLGNLLGFMVARSDPEDYGTLSSYKVESASAVKGPIQVNQDILSTPEISQPLALLNQQGSEVLQGSLQLIPIGDSILYIRPYYVQGQSGSRLPELRFVAADYDGRAVMKSTLQEALAALFQGFSSPGPQTPTTPSGPTQTTSLIDQAAAALADADAKLRAGDLAGYQADVNRARQLLEEARSGSSPTTTSTTRPSA